MRILYNEDKNGYEVAVNEVEKTVCTPLLERYGFKWSENKKLFWAPVNEQSSLFLQMVSHLKGAELNIPKKLNLAGNIRNFFSRGNYNFADIATLSEVTEEEVKLKAVELYSDAELTRMGLYDKIIDHEVEGAVVSCIAMFPATEDKAVQYLLKERGVLVSDSSLAAIRKKNGCEVNNNVDPQKAATKPAVKKTEQKEKPTPTQKQKKPENVELEAVKVDDIKREYYNEHENCTSMHVREALKTGEFDIPLIAKKAGVKEDSVKCKIIEVLTKYELQRYGFLDDFGPSWEDEKKIVAYVHRQKELPETWKLKVAIEKATGVKVTLSALKAVLKKHDIKENVPEVVYRPRKKGR